MASSSARSKRSVSVAWSRLARLMCASSSTSSSNSTITRETIRAATTNSCSDRHLRSTRTPTWSGGSASADFSASTTERPHEGAAEYLHLTGTNGTRTRDTCPVLCRRTGTARLGSPGGDPRAPGFAPGRGDSPGLGCVFAPYAMPTSAAPGCPRPITPRSPGVASISTSRCVAPPRVPACISLSTARGAAGRRTPPTVRRSSRPGP